MSPSVRPMEPPMAKPSKARQELIARCCHSSPLAESVQKAFSTPSGEGRIRVESQPTDDANCQISTVPTGKNQGARRNRSFCEEAAIVRSLTLRRFTRDKFVRHRFALQAQVLRLRDRRDVDIEQREQQFADSPGFLKVRVAGEDKTVDA